MGVRSKEEEDPAHLSSFLCARWHGRHCENRQLYRKYCQNWSILSPLFQSRSLLLVISKNYLVCEFQAFPCYFTPFPSRVIWLWPSPFLPLPSPPPPSPEVSSYYPFPLFTKSFFLFSLHYSLFAKKTLCCPLPPPSLSPNFSKMISSFFSSSEIPFSFPRSLPRTR